MKTEQQNQNPPKLGLDTIAALDCALAKLNRKAVCDEWLNKKPSAEVVEAFGE